MEVNLNSLTGELGVLIFGVAAALMFLAGYFYTIYEFKQLKDQRKEKAEQEDTIELVK